VEAGVPLDGFEEFLELPTDGQVGVVAWFVGTLQSSLLSPLIGVRMLAHGFLVFL
jgi:hypothetical protein